MTKSKSNKNDLLKILEEAKKRTDEVKQFKLEEFCFDKQLAYITDSSRFKTACTSRRAGKTISIAAEFIDCCLKEQNVVCLYVTQTSRNARNILWPELKRIVEEYKISVKTDDTRMTMRFLDTGSEIRLGGAKDESQIENYRGWKLRKVKVDEAQSFRPYLTYFIDDILLPSLRDLRGDLSITGTPGPIPAGPFYDYTHSKNWTHHHWTAFENPHMKDLDKTLAEERAVKGIDESNPGYIRETYGRWVYDPDSLVYKFSKDKNLYDSLPAKKLEYVFGIDIGFNDADAVAVLGYNYTEKIVYLVEEIVQSKQDITSLVNTIKKLKDKYKPIKMVMDAGALGKKIQEEIRVRHGLHLDAAQKERKLEFIELLNDDLRTAKFKAFHGSIFEQDCYLVQWDRSNLEKPKISDTYHTDINDAIIYAWRECRHYLSEADKVAPKPTEASYGQYLEQLAMERFEKAQKKHELDISQEDIDFIYDDE